MALNRDDLQAAPPDDGGHQGAHTKPQDMLQTPELDAPAQPETAHDPVRSPAERRSAPMNPFTILVLALSFFSAIYLLWWQLS